MRIELREQKQGGLAAVVVLPEPILPKTPPADPPHVVPMQGDAPRFTLPGALAEANSNVLPERAERTAEIPLPIPAQTQTPAPAPAPAPTPVPAEADTHERVDEPTFEMRLPTPETAVEAAEPEPRPTVPAQRVTDKGLPKRTPKVVKAGSTAPAAHKGGAEVADALRRRLGGFQQGALEGRRHAETEIQDAQSEVQNDTHGEEKKAQRPQTGETVEEARS